MNTVRRFSFVERGSRCNGTLLVALVGGLVELVLLLLWQRNAYWSYSDGVNAQSARQILHGLTPYREFAAAQPPLVYYVGAALLAVRDSLGTLRVGLGLVDVVTALLAGVYVWRLTGRRVLTILTVWIAPLLPISLASHAQLVPETLAAPLLLAGGLCCAEPATAFLGGVLLAAAVSCKLAFVVPAVVVLVLSARPVRAALALGGCLLTGAVVCFVVFGAGFGREVVGAQLEVGAAPAHAVAGLLAQESWSELPLAIGCAGAALLSRPRLNRERTLAKVAVGLAVSCALLGLTVAKRGSYINVLSVADPPLLVIAAIGAWRVWHRGPLARGSVLVFMILFLLEPLSILTTPSTLR